MQNSDKEYQNFKRELQKENLSPEEYQRKIIEWCKKHDY